MPGQHAVSLGLYRRFFTPADYRALLQRAKKLQGKQVLMVNSSAAGGGLQRLLPLMRGLNINATWKALNGSEAFFRSTKKLHNGLQGAPTTLSKTERSRYERSVLKQYKSLGLHNADAVVIHDPQPLPLVQYRNPAVPWIWRRHVDASHPHAGLLHYLQTFIEQYDAMIILHVRYRHLRLHLPQKVIVPLVG